MVTFKETNIETSLTKALDALMTYRKRIKLISFVFKKGISSNEKQKDFAMDGVSSFCKSIAYLADNYRNLTTITFELK